MIGDASGTGAVGRIRRNRAVIRRQVPGGCMSDYASLIRPTAAVYRIDGGCMTVFVIKIGNRREVYR